MLVTALVVILLTTIVYFIHVKFFKLTPIDPAKKLVVVTGAAQGIGLATVHKLIQLNCVVIAADIQKEKLQKELGDRENVHLLHVDVTNLSDIESKLVDKVKELKLPVFGVVNNAGIAPTSTSALVDKTDQETMLLTQVNLLASQRIVKALYPYMVRVKGTGEGERIEPAVGSCIVNISSILSFMPLPFSGYYCMTKAGTSMFSDVLRRELRSKKIRVSCIEPGGIDTSILHLRPFIENTEFDSEASSSSSAWDKLVTKSKRLNPPSYIAGLIVKCLFHSRNNGYDGIERLIGESHWPEYLVYSLYPLLPIRLADIILRMKM